MTIDEQTAPVIPAAAPAGASAVDIDPDKLMGFVFRAVDEVGAALNAALVVMGDQLGYYRALADHGPITADAAGPTDLDRRQVRPRVAERPGRGVLPLLRSGDRDVRALPRSTRSRSPTSPVPPSCRACSRSPTAPSGTRRGSSSWLASGDGLGWHDHNSDVHEGCERFFRPGYLANLVDAWLPALDGVVDKLRSGARVADIGCGFGASTVLMASAFPASRFVGSDYHETSIETARERAGQAGVGESAQFEVAPATGFTGSGFDLVTTFDALHDLGDPVGAARHVFEALDDDGTWMVVEPIAGDHIEDNFNPVGRVYYGFSTLLCTPASLSQSPGLALGTQAGPARIRDVTVAAGFSRFSTVASTPFNNVFEVRK